MTSTLVETVNINFDDFSENFLTCSTCLHLFDQDKRKAKLLPCSHSVCQSCLQQIVCLPPNDGLTVRCPMCRDDCMLPSGGVSGLPPAFLINQLLDVMQRQRKEFVPSCSNHPSEQLLYCEYCDFVFCHHCHSSVINKKCTQHAVIPLSIALKRMSEIVIYRAKGRLRALDLARVTVDEEITLLDQNVDKIVDQINATFQEVSNIVEIRRRELIENVRVTRDKKRKVLKDQIEMIADEKKKLAKELDNCQVDVRTMGRQLRSFDSNSDLQLCQPRENAFLRLNTTSSQLLCDIQQCVSNFGTITASTTFPGESTIDQVEHCSINTECKLLVRTCDVNGKARTSGGDPLDVSLKSKSGQDIGATVHDMNDGTYELSFRVQEPGTYTATVNIFGRPIKDSPLQLTVSSRHKAKWQLEAELLQPTRMSTLDDVFYVLDTGHCRIRMFKDNGAIIGEIKSKCLEGNSAVGMVVLSSSEIVVLNWKTKTITKITTKGEELQAVTFSEFQEPIDLALDRRGRFIIADKNKVFVFDPSLRPLFSFPAKGLRISGVKAGLDDDILVSTTTGLLLYDGTGKFLREIELGPKNHRGKLMSTSCSVCPSTGLIISGTLDMKTNKTYLATCSYKGLFQFWIDTCDTPLRSPSCITIGSGKFQGMCFVIDHITNSLKLYRYK